MRLTTKQVLGLMTLVAILSFVTTAVLVPLLWFGLICPQSENAVTVLSALSFAVGIFFVDAVVTNNGLRRTEKNVKLAIREHDDRTIQETNSLIQQQHRAWELMKEMSGILKKIDSAGGRS